MRPCARRWARGAAAILAVPALVLGSLALALQSVSPKVEHHEESCGLETKGLEARFEEARARVQGARLDTVDLRPVADLSARVVRGEVNVGLDAGADVAGLAARTGLAVKRALPSVATLYGALDSPEALRAVTTVLAAQPGVRWAEPNFVAKAASTPNDVFFPLQKGARHANIEAAWNVTTGDPSVIVAVLDTGADLAHKDLAGQLVAGFDFVNNTANPVDDNGHGTSVTGIIAAAGNNNEGVAGVAYGARVMPIKVADSDGNASVADVAAGMDFAIAHGAKIVNVSLGSRVNSQALQDAVNRALNAGLLVVAAAGNDPVHVVCYPAAYAGVVSVGSVSDAGELAFSSVISTQVDVGAPGEDLISTLPGDVYGYVSGSSASAAFASGVAALCLSHNKALTAPQVAQCLRGAQTPVASLTPASYFKMGSLDVLAAVNRADPTYVEVAVTDVRSYPAKPLPGQAGKLVVQLANYGNSDAANMSVTVSVQGAGAASPAATLTGSLASLPMGQRGEIAIPWTTPATGTYTITAQVGVATGASSLTRAQMAAPLEVNPAAWPDLRVVERTVSDPNLTTGTVTLGMTVENRGTAAANNVTLEAHVNGAVVATTTVATLAAGDRTTWNPVWTVPTPAPAGMVRFEAFALPLPGETATADNTAVMDFYVGSQTALRGLYQQSNGVDVIPDAPWRVEPGRDYVPIQAFVPSKGSTSTTTTLQFDRALVTVRDDPAATTGTVVFDQSFGQNPTTAVPGIVIVDEMGVPRTGATAQQLFGSAVLDTNGHHDIIRLPRSAFGVASTPSSTIVKFVDVDLQWTYKETILWVISTTRTGHHRAVLRVQFGPASLPSLPGENHSYDVHHHTIAEWFFGSPLNIFCPRKAYGGPLQMVKESGYALGITTAPDDVNGKIICTDHNCFYNRTIQDADGADHRPPFGPQSITAQPGTTEKQAYETIFGVASGEEVAFKENIPLSSFSAGIGSVLNGLFPGLPIGAHMLTMKAQHVEGPWHGGGYLKGPGNPNIDVELVPLLGQLAQGGQLAPWGPQTGSGAFCYAAHPFSGQGWDQGKLTQCFGLDPAQAPRDTSMVHPQTNKFVLKGLEFWNGRGTRSLDTSKIDFNDLNPWSDPTYAAGSSDWDLGVQGGLATWHQYLSQTLDYSFASDPDTHFTRKVYVAAGSDAHGDFNFGVSRLATPISLASTYSVDDAAWYGVRTYVFADGKQGTASTDRFMAAYEDGNSIMTDGPLLKFSMDADAHWDSDKLAYHAASSAENADGQIGGEGALDGGRTMLVRRNSSDIVFRYRYTNSPEFGSNGGQIAAIKIYKTMAGLPNPTRTRGNTPQLVGVGSLATTGQDQDLTQPIDLMSEGSFDRPGCFTLGAFTGGDPDKTDLAPSEYRCYTNPVFAVPYDVSVSVGAVDSATKSIPAGGLTVTFSFDQTMSPALLAAELKNVGSNGTSTDGTQPALAALAPAGGQNGWTDRPGLKCSVLTLANVQPVLVTGDEYPKGSGNVTFVLYTRDRIRDAAGNPLHSIATTATATRLQGPPPVPSVGGTNPGSTQPGSTQPGSTQQGSTGFGGGGGGGGSGGCVVAGTSHEGGFAVLLPQLLVAVVLVLRRRRR